MVQWIKNQISIAIVCLNAILYRHQYHYFDVTIVAVIPSPVNRAIAGTKLAVTMIRTLNNCLLYQFRSNGVYGIVYGVSL